MDNQPAERDVESAYGSDVTSNSILITEKEEFIIEELILQKETWFQWLKLQIRHYKIFELLLFIILVLYISSQNQKMSSIQTQINNIEKRVGPNNDLKKDNLKGEAENKLKENQDMELLATEIPTEETTTSIAMSKNVEETEPSQEITTFISQEKIPERANLSNFKRKQERSTHQFNAASYMMGARVDSFLSSSSPSSPNFGSDKSGYVLFERDEIPPNKAWCSEEKNPILTVILVDDIRPIAVSYQHTTWYGMIPDGAPKIYDLIACLDRLCNKKELIVSNCEYKATDDNRQEQICSIPFNRNLTSVGKVEFHFRENHGNKTKTCVSLVRLYGERSGPSKEIEDPVKNAEICSNLTSKYHNEQMESNCTLLYSKGCCTKCPECCRECKIEDKNYKARLLVLLIIVSSFFIFTFCTGFIQCVLYLYKKRKSSRNNIH